MELIIITQQDQEVTQPYRAGATAGLAADFHLVTPFYLQRHQDLEPSSPQFYIYMAVERTLNLSKGSAPIC